MQLIHKNFHHNSSEEFKTLNCQPPSSHCFCKLNLNTIKSSLFNTYSYLTLRPSFADKNIAVNSSFRLAYCKFLTINKPNIFITSYTIALPQQMYSRKYVKLTSLIASYLTYFYFPCQCS